MLKYNNPMLLSLLRLWTGPLPKQEIFPDHPTNPLVHWLIHPLKRRLAKYYLVVLRKLFGLKVIALTGSAGKTTTSNILYSIFSQNGPTVKTADSITTTYNIPSTILRCTPKTRYLILEMGVEYPGDMTFYTWLAVPDIAILLNISSVHSFFLGSLQNIFAEKSLLLQKTSAQSGLSLYNADDPHIHLTPNSRLVPFGNRLHSYVQTLSAKITSKLTTELTFRISPSKDLLKVNLPFIGTHLSHNVAASVAAAKLLGLSNLEIETGIYRTPHPKHRLEVLRTVSGHILIDDSYNANPLSTAESINVLAQISKITHTTPLLILGQMNELGSFEKPAHQQIGELIKKLTIKHLYTIGPATSLVIRHAKTGRYFENATQLSKSLGIALKTRRQLTILVKGSRSWHLENLIPKILSV